LCPILEIRARRLSTENEDVYNTDMKKIFKGFREFILRGNVVDLAVGVVIGASFGTLVNSLVKDILTPFIGAIAKVPDFSDLSFVIRGSTFTYGSFLNALIAFFIVAIAIYFFVVLPLNSFLARVKREEETTPPPAPMPSEDILLLREIRDLIKK
jgi:large conductance mechanosensitive channel